MVIVSAKVSKRKLLLAIAAAVLIILLLVFLLDRSGQQSQPPQSSQEQTPALQAGSNEERIAFLQSYGWQVSERPTQSQEVGIPEEFNDVFTRYNELQKSQGFDLSPYAGKTVKRYVYAIGNYPDGTSGHSATVLVYRNRIIGGEVSTKADGGRMHGLQRPG